MQKLLTFFSKNISVYAIFNDQSFNDTLTNDVVSFEQLGPALLGKNLLHLGANSFLIEKTSFKKETEQFGHSCFPRKCISCP